METTNQQSSLWNELRQELDEHLDTIRREESSLQLMSSRSMIYATEMLSKLQSAVSSHVFKQTEEILFYKEIKPHFISRIIFFSRLFKIETAKPPTGQAGLVTYYTNEINRLVEIYNEHRFIRLYIENGATYLDEKLFFRPGPDSAIALSGIEPVADGAFPICYDYVVGQLLAADLLKKYLLQAIENLASSGPNGGDLPRITWTAAKAHGIELGYALYAAGVVNNGKAQLKDIMECLGVAFHTDWGNYARTWQEILYRKGGRTVFQDNMKNKYLLYIQRIEDKDIR